MATAVVIAVLGSFAYLSLDVGQLLSAEAAGEMLRFMLSFFPPELSPAFVSKTVDSMFETFAVSAIGTLLASVVGFAVALPASGMYGAGLRVLCPNSYGRP